LELAQTRPLLFQASACNREEEA
jgi:hypothetical protein